MEETARKLNSGEFTIWQKLVEEYQSQAIADLLHQSQQYTESLRNMAKSNGLINLPLVEAIYRSIQQLVTRWHQIPSTDQNWCKGAIAYYFLKEDEESDLDSYIGFEDDAEVINSACQHLGFTDLLIRVADFD